MPITRLPPDTVRLLGSSVAISSPASVVKELVDNAIDAGATSIEIVISQNTVEKIKVTDNGCGIAEDDFAALGRRASTSKIHTFEDLSCGVQTLGFRGEALASVRSVSDEVTIKTRTATDGRSWAWQFKLNPGEGGCDLTADDPHIRPGPVGTTVTVAGLFGAIPVRRQQAVKESRKTLARIRDMLLGYAFARPSLKLSFKVPWEPRQPWAYHPPSKQEHSCWDVITQKFGTTVARECVAVRGEKIIETLQTRNGNSSVPGIISLSAVMPSPTCKADVVKGKGAFICVNSRPITSTRGTAKKIYSLFRSYLTRGEGGLKFKPQSNPFLQLNIQCPPGTYDPNVAPLKDEILFHHEELILEAFEEICKNLYSETDLNPEANRPARPQDTSETISLGEHDSADLITETMENMACQARNNTEDDLTNDAATTSILVQPNAEANGAPRPQDAADQTTSLDEHVSVDLRTQTRVNMERKESDATDDYCMENLVTTRIPVHPIWSRKCDIHPDNSKATTSKELEKIQPREGLYQFFPPASPQRFHIAINDTATEAQTPMQQWENTVGDDCAGELDRLQLLANADNTRQPLKQLVSSCLADRDNRGPRAHHPNSPGNTISWNSRSMSPPRNPMEMGNPVITAEPPSPGMFSHSALRTPPLSNTWRRNETPNPSFRPPVLRREGTPSVGRRVVPRRSSSRLPLETIPSGTSTCALTMQLEISGADIAQSMDCFGQFDQSLTTGEIPNSLESKDMSEVMEVEDRLAGVVEGWVAGLDEDVDVEYSLQSHAKGKRRV